MKSSVLLVSAVAILIATATLAEAAAVAGGGTDGWSSASSLQPNSSVASGLVFAKKHAILALREKGLKLQAADGGTLTETHRAELQAQLDAIRSGNY